MARRPARSDTTRAITTVPQGSKHSTILILITSTTTKPATTAPTESSSATTSLPTELPAANNPERTVTWSPKTRSNTTAQLSVRMTNVGPPAYTSTAERK